MEVGKDQVISRGDFSASQSVPGERKDEHVRGHRSPEPLRGHYCSKGMSSREPRGTQACCCQPPQVCRLSIPPSQALTREAESQGPSPVVAPGLSGGGVLRSLDGQAGRPLGPSSPTHRCLMPPKFQRALLPESGCLSSPLIIKCCCLT